MGADDAGASAGRLPLDDAGGTSVGPDPYLQQRVDQLVVERLHALGGREGGDPVQVQGVVAHRT